jgi:hypothetical protein
VIVKGFRPKYSAWQGSVKGFSSTIAIPTTSVKRTIDTQGENGAEVAEEGTSMAAERTLKRARRAQDQDVVVLPSSNSITAEVNTARNQLEVESHLEEPGVSIEIERPAVRTTRNLHENSPLRLALITVKWRLERIKAVEKPQSTTSQLTDNVSHNPSRNSLRHSKLDKTNLYVPTSTKTYGGISIRLSSCQNINDFFVSMLAAWSLQGKEEKVEAIVAQFIWVGPRPIVTRRELPDSFRMLVEIMERAPCWKEDGDDQTCEVDIKILIA